MRISVPTLPYATFSSAGTNATRAISNTEAVERIALFLKNRSTAVITGAGVSVDSGIRAYRGSDGRYMNPNYKPIFYHELADQTAKGYAFRQRYWLRSYLGYPPVRDALPNPTHFAIAALQYTSHVHHLITQNVDGLHHKAISRVWDDTQMQDRILELHGTLHRVHCNRRHVTPREQFQDMLSSANPQWKAFAEDLERTGRKPRTNPDGDVVLEGVSYHDFVVPECPTCVLEGHRKSSWQKPEVVFFGESISKKVKHHSFEHVEVCDNLFVIGTTLATYSAFSVVKHAVELKKPVLLLNVGPTRADSVRGVEKIEMASGLVMRDVVRAVLGTNASEDPVVREMLVSGVVKPPEDEHGADATAIRTAT